MQRVLVVHHDPDDHLNELAGPLVEAGLELDAWCTWTEHRPAGEPEDYAGVISMGGIAGVEDHALHPWMAVESDYLRFALSHQRPVLGVCLGAQLLAKVCGGSVTKAPVPEIGWVSIESQPTAAEDPLLQAMGERFAAFQYHYDTFALPDDAVLLARNEACLQAFRVGDCAWGVQFHIEANPGLVLAWMGSFEGNMAAAGIDYGLLQKQTAEHWRAYRERCWTISAAFAAEVLARS